MPLVVPKRHWVADPSPDGFILFDVCAKPEARYTYTIPDLKIAKRVLEALNEAEPPVRCSGAGDFTIQRKRRT